MEIEKKTRNAVNESVQQTYLLGVSSQEPECAVDEEMDPLLAMLIMSEKRIASNFKCLEERYIWNSNR